jgi:L-ascorbate metabolism protein UlaG (beta-lactamase superfamily)
MAARRRLVAAVVVASVLTLPIRGASVDHVTMTWMSISNMYFEIGDLKVLIDGYITRLPPADFYGGGGGLAYTRRPFVPDRRAVSRVLDAIGGPASVTLLLTGHSHFDHSFDTPAWATLTGAPIMGSKTTCLQATASGIAADRCRSLNGGETIPLADGVTMHVVRWNHSGSSDTNPEQHDPVELSRPPTPDPATGGFRAGVAEDFPNGGGNRGYLFTVDGPSGRIGWFFNNSASAADLAKPIVVDGVDYGAPIDNLRQAMRESGLSSLDLWIGAGGLEVAKQVVPIIRPKAFLPVHWDSFNSPFEAGVRRPFADQPLEQFLNGEHVAVVRPAQYMDKWRLDPSGVHAVPNDAAKRALGF